jgi:hypothetical protein
MLIDDRVVKRQLAAWYQLRQQLETSDTPLEDTSRFFLRLPRVKIYTDPYDSATWPTPWELISENEYCEFNLILGMCYTLQLTERFKDCQPTINVSFDTVNKTVYYLLTLNDKVYGYDEDWIDAKDLPKSLKTQKIYVMKQLH